jgi:uncharacterized membrane protein
MSDTATSPDLDSLKKLTQVIYALQALGFVFGISFIAAVVVNYVKLDNVKGTWLESHFRWQMRTFWFSLLWAVIGGITFIFVIGWFILAADAVWVIYRIAKGWLDLNDGKEMR